MNGPGDAVLGLTYGEVRLVPSDHGLASGVRAACCTAAGHARDMARGACTAGKAAFVGHSSPPRKRGGKQHHPAPGARPACRTTRLAVPEVREAIAIPTTRLIAPVATFVDSDEDEANGISVAARINRPIIQWK
jgi:hypothetical protein